MSRTTKDSSLPRSHASILVATLGASILSSLDLFIVNLALPRIGEAFPTASPQAMSWVLNAYTVAFAALLAPAGRIADRFGQRRVFIIGLTAFTVGAVLATVTPSVGLLIVARALQGVGASVIVPTSLALLLAVYPKSTHKRMVSIWAASGSVAAALGPSLGGILADADWRLVFALKIPLAVFALLGARGLPASKPESGRIPDLSGAIAVAGTIAVLVTLLSFWADWGPRDFRFWSISGLGVIAFIWFVYRSKRHPVPVIDLRLFRIPAFTFSAIGMTAFYCGFSMMLLACSLWATNVWGWDSTLTGLCFILGPGMGVVSALVAGRTTIAPEWLSAAGGLLFSSAGVIWALNLTQQQSSPLSFMAGFMLAGVAAGIAQTGFLSGGAGALPPDNYASGTGIINTGRQIGAAVGVALLILFVGSGHEASTYLIAWITIAVSGTIATLAILPALKGTKFRPTDQTDSLSSPR